jgi:arylsulfatase A-like enzyme
MYESRPNFRLIPLVVGILILMTALAGCRGRKNGTSAPKTGPEVAIDFAIKTEPGAPRPDVYLIGVDTLRADHLHCYGYYKKTSPLIDRFAEKSVLFENCQSPTPRTTQTVASIMTGRYPQSHGVRSLNDRLPESEITLAEILKKADYTTLSVQATGMIHKAVDQGFDQVDSTLLEIAAKKTTNKAIRMLKEAGDAPVFLWAFYRDPHMPYKPPVDHFDKKYKGRFKNEIAYFPSKGRIVYKNNMTVRERYHANALYDSEIRFLDQELGRLLAFIEGRNRPAIIVFTSDHGESLGENDYFFDHGDILNQPNLHVPLIIRGLDIPQKRVERMVRLIDIAPTILAALKIEVPTARFEGIDLVAFAADPSVQLVAYAETGQALLDEAFEVGTREVPGIEGRPRSITFKNQRGIYFPTKEGIRYHLYDLEKDPDGKTDLYPQVGTEPLFARLKAWIDSAESDSQERPLTEEEKKKFHSLGYL